MFMRETRLVPLAATECSDPYSKTIKRQWVLCSLSNRNFGILAPGPWPTESPQTTQPLVVLALATAAVVTTRTAVTAEYVSIDGVWLGAQVHGTLV